MVTNRNFSREYLCNYMYIFITFHEVIKYLGKKSIFPSFSNFIKFNLLLFLVISGPAATQVEMFLFISFQQYNQLQLCVSSSTSFS